MNKTAYNERVLSQVRKKWPSADYARINGAFEEIVVLLDLARQFEARRHEREIERHTSMRVLSALHKALLQSSVVYFSIFLHEICGRPVKDITLQKFIKLPIVVRSRKYKDLLGGYCIEIYRNKLVAHNQVYRINGSTVEADGTFRLSPTGVFHNRLNGKKRSIKTLGKRNGVEVENYFEAVEALFYSVPLPDDWNVQKDRIEVDKLIEQVGCKSPGVESIERYVDEFSLACVQMPKRLKRRTPKTQRVNNPRSTRLA